MVNMKTKTKAKQAKLTVMTHHNAGVAVDVIKEAADETDEKFNRITFEQSTKDLRVLPFRLRRNIQKKMTETQNAAMKLASLTEEAEEWLSENEVGR
jgi:hypothetical protein